MDDLAHAATKRGALSSRMASGMITSITGQVISQILRLGGNLVLARLLFPEAFGLMALVNLLMWTLQSLSDVGVSAAIIRHERGDDPRFLDTAFTVQVLRGAALWIVGTALAIPMAHLYGEPGLVELVPVASFSAVVSGFTSTKLISLARKILPARIVAIEIGSQAASLIAIAAIAYWKRSVWALVIGGLLSAALRVVASHVAIPGRRDRFDWDRAAVRELALFGRWVTLSTTFNFIAFRIDLALVALLVPVDILGIYSIAIMLSNVVREVLAQFNGLIVLPTLSTALRSGPDALPRVIVRVRGNILPAALAGTVAAVSLAPVLFDGLYDPRYHDAGWIAQLSMLGVWFSYLCDMSGSALLAIGDSRSWAITTAFKAVATTVGCLVGNWLGGLPGLILGAAASALSTYLLAVWQLARHGVHILRGDLRFSAFGVALCLVAAGLPRLLSGGVSGRVLAAWSAGVAVLMVTPLAFWALRRLRRNVEV